MSGPIGELTPDLKVLVDAEIAGGGGGSLPAGGSTGEVLTKESNADGDVGWEPGGGSLLSAGTPKAADDTTYFGLPPSVTTSSAWSVPNLPEDGTFAWYAPLLITEPLTITDIEILIEAGATYIIVGVNQGTKTFTTGDDVTGQVMAGNSITVQGSTGNDGTYTVVSSAFDTDHTDVVVAEAIPDPTADGGFVVVLDSHVRVAITALDADWQPTGDVLYQEAVPAATGGQIDISGVDLPLDPGLYAFVRETDDINLLVDLRPGSFPGGVHCEDESTKVICGFTAPHVYGPFVGTLPEWETADTTNTNDEGYISYPFVVKWTIP